MRYSVVITSDAKTSIRESFNYISDRAPLNAARWLRAPRAEIDSLGTFPERCAAAREREHIDEGLRQIVFKSHRIVFLVKEKTKRVEVLDVRHVKRRAVGGPYQEDGEEDS